MYFKAVCSSSDLLTLYRVIWPHSDCSRSEILWIGGEGGGGRGGRRVIGEVAKDLVELCSFLF